MSDSIHSTSSHIPKIPDPVVLTWTPDYGGGDVAYIAGSPPVPPPPPPSAASASTTSIATVRQQPLPPPPPPPPSAASGISDHLGNSYRASAASLANATVGHGSTSRRVSLIEETSALNSETEQSSPDYAPTYPVDYTFSPVNGDPQSMVVTPPPGVVDTRPLYHIRVVHDLFDPSFFVTSIWKGANDGYFVGDFKTKAGCSVLEETVYFKQSEDHISKKLVASTRRDEFQWKLQHESGGLLLWRWEKWWTCRHVPEQTASKNKHYGILAQFYPPTLRSPSNARQVARITVEPAGQKFFDEILLSVLILERKRKKIMARRN